MHDSERSASHNSKLGTIHFWPRLVSGVAEPNDRYRCTAAAERCALGWQEVVDPHVPGTGTVRSQGRRSARWRRVVNRPAEPDHRRWQSVLLSVGIPQSCGGPDNQRRPGAPN